MKQVNEKVDFLVKKVSSLNSSANVQPKQDHQKANKKKKILIIGDSLSRNLNVSVLKNVIDMDVKRAEAFIIGQNDPRSRFPDQNFTDIVPKELKKEEFSTLILQGGTNEVSNLDISGNAGERIETLKEEIKVSSEKLFCIAEKSLEENKSLDNVLIFKRIFRCDTLKNDPTQIRSKLSDFGNRVLDDLWLTKGCPKNIKIVEQSLKCQGDLRVSRFGFPSAQGYDGVHMRGKLAVQHYTGSLINVVLDALTNSNTNTGPKININPQPSYANIVRNESSTNQFMFKEPNQNMKSQPNFNFSQAQPQLGSYFAQRNKKQPDTTNTNQQNSQMFGATQPPTTGSNSSSLGGNYQYNVKTQNRFSAAVSGN